MSLDAAMKQLAAAKAALEQAEAGVVEETEEAGSGISVTIDELVGSNLNAGEIMATAADALRQIGATRDQIHDYRREAISGSYQHLCDVTRRWLTEGPPGGLIPEEGPES